MASILSDIGTSVGSEVKTLADKVTTLETVVSLPNYAVSGVPAASPAGQLIYVTDGDSGSATVACSDGSAWKVVALGATIST